MGRQLKWETLEKEIFPKPKEVLKEIKEIQMQKALRDRYLK